MTMQKNDKMQDLEARGNLLIRLLPRSARKKIKSQKLISMYFGRINQDQEYIGMIRKKPEESRLN